MKTNKYKRSGNKNMAGMETPRTETGKDIIPAREQDEMISISSQIDKAFAAIDSGILSIVPFHRERVPGPDSSGVGRALPRRRGMMMMRRETT